MTTRHRISRGPLRLATETNPHGPGWRIAIRLGRGKGYRAWDFPWHSTNVAAPWWRRHAFVSYIPGYTLEIATNQRTIGNRGERHRLVVTLHRRSVVRTVPAWWP